MILWAPRYLPFLANEWGAANSNGLLASSQALPDNLKSFPRAVAHRAALMFLFGLRGVAADRADVELARLADPGILLSRLEQRNRLAVEPRVGLLRLQRPGKGADGGGVLALRGFGQEAGIHGVDLVLLAVQRGLQVVQGALRLDGVNRALGAGAQLADDAGVIAGVNLLGARRGAKEAGRAMQSLLVGFGGKGGVLGVRIRLALKGGQ